VTDFAEHRLSKWLLEEARYLGSIPEVLNGFCSALADEGFGIRRATLAMKTLHPQIEVLRYVWMDENIAAEKMDNPFVYHHDTYQFERGSCIETFLSFGCTTTAQLQKSPFWLLFEGRTSVYFKVNDEKTQIQYPLFKELSAIGATTYFATRLNNDEQNLHMMSLVSNNSDGFDKDQIAQLEQLIPILSLCLELKLQELVKTTLLDVYIGHTPGQKVLSGSIKPGDVERVEAAIWYSDLRNFTGLSNETKPHEMVTWLNEYFACLVESIYGCNGEVLKFVGDAMLAIFPVTENVSSQKSCSEALSAAREANRRLADWNEARSNKRLPALKHGIALHYGEVLYGNVGGLKRLDFTVIGATINLAARIEGLSSQLDVSLLASSSFVGYCDDAFEKAGEFEAKGFKKKIECYLPC